MDRDASIGPDGLTRCDRDLIRDVLARYPEVRRVSLFGSRAMGTFGRGSDIDLALEGPDLDSPTLTRIATELEDSDLPYKVDLLLRDEHLEPKLEAHIRRYGKPIGWKETTLLDVSTDIAYGYTQSADSEKVGPHFLRITDIQNGTVDWSTVPYCPINAGDYAKYKLKSGDIVVARTGNSTGENYIFRADEDAVFASYLIRFRIDPAQADQLFVWYWMRTPAWRSFVNNSKTGSAQAGANAKILGSYRFTLPPLDEQRAIASVLGALDDKIELNRLTALALERLARAIFRAWFVDFEPVKAKAAGATAFPSMPQPVFDALPTRFIDSDLGPVPEGWEVKPIATIGTFLNGLALQKYPPRGDGKDLRVIKIAELRKGSAHSADWANSDVPEQYVIEDRDLLFSWSGTLEAEFWFGGKGALNQHLFKVTSTQYPSWFCFLWIRQHLPWFRAIAASKATTMGHIKRSHLQETQVVVPAEDILQAADAVLEPLYGLHAQVMVESRRLAGMRDYLLPKLLSGELSVSELDLSQVAVS